MVDALKVDALKVDTFKADAFKADAFKVDASKVLKYSFSTYCTIDVCKVMVKIMHKGRRILGPSSWSGANILIRNTSKG